MKEKLTSFSRSLFITKKLHHRYLISQIGWVLVTTPEAATGDFCSVKKGVLKNLAKFTRKHLLESLF